MIRREPIALVLAILLPACTLATPMPLAATSSGSPARPRLRWATTQGSVLANDGDPVRSAVPMLLVVGAADPQDPPPNIADAPVELPRSTTVVVPGHGHGIAHVGCMPGPIAAFVDAGTAAALDVRCAANVPVPSFITWP